ncbi:MAG TPA: hypothetical protein VFF65_05460, partial [Phycisphaerales bacterium]|nr:hypothetical protein [Phycisphaerales bacterium]
QRFPEAKTPLLENALSAAEHQLLAQDLGEFERTGVRTLIALERFRLDAGRYPLSLDELVDRYLPSVPLDCMAGGPLLYRPLQSGADPLGRGFVLYSKGPDGADNGGAAGAGDWSRLAAPLRGHDHVFNAPR